MGDRFFLQYLSGYLLARIDTERGGNDLYTCLNVSPDVVPFASASAIGLALYVGVSVPMSSKMFCAWRKRIMRSILLALPL